MRFGLTGCPTRGQETLRPLLGCLNWVWEVKVPGLLGVGCTVANLPLSKPQLGHQSDDVDGDNFNMDTVVVISRFGICSRLKKALRILTCLKLTSVKD